jgi:LacI family fructose operon transcriptional repressor
MPLLKPRFYALHMPRPTLQQIADIIGVSRVTVSLALRSHPSIPKSTREKIVACAEKIGYRPNPLISALMVDLRSRSDSRRWCSLAYVTPFPAAAMDVLPAARRYFEGAKKRAGDLGYDLVYFHYGEGVLTDARLGKILYARNISGVLLSPGTKANYTITLPWQHNCTATLGYTLQTPMLNRSVNHQFHTITMAIKKARQYGYKKPGLLLNDEDDEKTEHLLMAGFLAHQTTLEPAARVPILYRDSISDTELKKWLFKYKPDALLVLRPSWVERIRSAGIKVPGDIALALLDRSDVHRDVAGIDQRPDLVGAAGIDLVTQDLITSNYGLPAAPKTVLTEGIWVDGATMPPIRQGG